MATPEFEVRENTDLSRYEAFFEGDLAGFAAYHDTADARVFTHTQVDDDYEGHGVGSRLVRAALDDVRARGMQFVPRCPFIAAWLKRHREYLDLVRP